MNVKLSVPPLYFSKLNTFSLLSLASFEEIIKNLNGTCLLMSSDKTVPTRFPFQFYDNFTTALAGLRALEWKNKVGTYSIFK